MEEGSGGSRTSSVRSHHGRAAADPNQGPGHPAWPSTSPTNTVKNRKDAKAGGAAATASKAKQGQSRQTAKTNSQTNPTNNLPDLTLSTTDNSAHKTEANPDKKDTTAPLDPISHHAPLDPDSDPPQELPQAFQVASQAHKVEAKPSQSQIEPCQPEPPPSLVSDCGDSGISASNDSQYYAKMTIIDDTDSLNNSISEDPEEEEEEQNRLEVGRTKYTRSISEPPREATLSLAATPVRKLSECEQRSNQLTGLFFQVASLDFGRDNIFCLRIFGCKNDIMFAAAIGK